MPPTTRNIRLVCAIALALALSPVSLASTDGAPEQAWRGWHGVLFRVTPLDSGAGAKPTRPPPVSYLFGSVHYGSMDELGLEAAALQERLKAVHTLVNEVDTATPFDSSLDHYRYHAHHITTRGMLGQAGFEQLQLLLPAIKPEQLDRFKPWLILALLESRGEIASDNNLDGLLVKWSKDAQLPQVHLESLHDQLQALDCVPDQEEAMVLAQRVAEPWVLREQSERVLGYYRARNLVAWLDEEDAMIGLDPRGRAIESRARHCLVEERNERWLQRLDPMLRADSCFVAVGAIHLVGEQGLLNQLSRRGFSVASEPL
jgi:uncharacterized protein YbaP (TraB family)